jgi:putative DNA primase/helicase
VIWSTRAHLQARHFSDGLLTDTRNIDVNNRLKPEGTIHGWFNAVKSVLKYHRLKFAMYYAIGSLFLAPCKASNSAFGIIGDTSIGKTFTLQVVASMFGNPSEKGDGLLLNGDSSLTALNAILTTLTDIPVFIDEITRMSEDTKKALTYAIGNGQESLRGKVDGNLRSSRMIRCNALITGENDLVSEFAHNGAQVRAFSCKDRPIPEIETIIIENARNGVLENYGHVLKLVLAKYFNDPSKVKGLFDFAANRLYQTTDDTIAKRKVAYFAVAEVGGMYLEQVFKENGMPSENPKDIIDKAWNEFVLENPDIPLEVKALGDVYKWAMANPTNFLVGSEEPAEIHPSTSIPN